MINSVAQSYIDTIEETCKRVKPRIVIQCITFNHEKYIRDALEGFIMQKTDFPFVAIVHDDASIDSTANIVKEYAEKYPDIILPIYEVENQYSKPDGSLGEILYQAINATGAEYIAMCEGDDYWIDSNKLQIQVDFLDNNPEYTACITKYKSIKSISKQIYAIGGREYSTIWDMLWHDVQFATATIVFRSNIYKKYVIEIEPQKKDWLMGDKPLILYLGHEGIVKLIDQITTVYRILESSASHSSDINLQIKRARNTIDIYLFFANLYFPNNIELRNKLEGGYLYRVFLIYRKANVNLPLDLKQNILSYRGKYTKLRIIKLFIKYPYILKLMYCIARFKDQLMIWKHKLISDQ